MSVGFANQRWGGRLALLTLSVALAGLTGCAVTPTPLTDDENKSRVAEDRAALTKDQEPLAGPVSLYEAMARALKYNLDFKVELMRRTLAQRELDVRHHDLLPRFVANLDYAARDNWNGARSMSLITWRQSLEPSTSTDKSIFSADLGLTWDVLDFGVSWYRAHQFADKVLIQEEQKRKVVNRILQDVHTAYWRVAAHERLKADLLALAQRVETALARSRETARGKLVEPAAALAYQRELLAIQRELQQLERHLTLAKAQLAALMNLPPGQDFTVVLPSRLEWNRALPMSVAEMEQTAMENRPELRSLAYQKRANAHEAKAALLSLFPSFRLSAGYNYNDNGFLYENDWMSVGAHLSWNLLNLLRYPDKQREVEAADKVLDAERLAMSMAVLTQVHVGLAQYAHARREFATAADHCAVQESIAEQTRAKYQVGSLGEQALIREEMNTLISKVRRDVAFADLGAAYAALMASMGVDPIPADAELAQPVQRLALRLEEYWEKR